MTSVKTPAPLPMGVPAPNLLVVGAGFGRTGTTSLRQALVRLGFDPCDHMDENFEHPERFAPWRESLRHKQAGEPVDWRPLLADYRAIVDWPGAYFWRELTSAHPEAKVILTVREPDRWYGSVLATISAFRTRMRAGDSLATRARSLLLRLGMLGTNGALRFCDDVIWDGTFNGRFRDRDHALRVFAEHNQAVRPTIPPERLLVFDVKQGWDPLCRFLGLPVPVGEPFPHVSDASSVQWELRERYRDGALRTGGIAAGVLLGLMTLAWFRRPLRRRTTAAKS
jgi:hypothetical protein